MPYQIPGQIVFRSALSAKTDKKIWGPKLLLH